MLLTEVRRIQTARRLQALAAGETLADVDHIIRNQIVLDMEVLGSTEFPVSNRTSIRTTGSYAGTAADSSVITSTSPC